MLNIRNHILIIFLKFEEIEVGNFIHDSKIKQLFYCHNYVFTKFVITTRELHEGFDVKQLSLKILSVLRAWRIYGI